MTPTDDMILCYVKGKRAYFTSRPLSKQNGDDWNDIPYEHNAGEPYQNEEGSVGFVYFEAELQQPCDGHINSPYSVDMINAGVCAWLFPSIWAEHDVCIRAGTTFEDFVAAIHSIDGTVYVPLKETKQ